MGKDQEKQVLDQALAELAEEQVDEVQVLARASLNNMFALFRLVVIHNLNNEAFIKPIQNMVGLFEHYRARGGAFALLLRGDNFYVGTTMVRLDSTSFDAAQGMLELWEELGIGAVTASGRVSPEHIAEMLEEIQQTMKMKARQKLGFLVGKKFGPIQIRSTVGPGDPMAELKRELQRLYGIVVVARQEFAELGAKGRFPPLRRLKRLCQRLADLARKSPPLTGALAMFQGGEVHELYHPVNVAILSLLIGQQLGLSRRELITLALAALIHDVGMDDRLGHKGSSPAPEAVRMLIEHKGLNEQLLQWTVTADELAFYNGYVPKRDQWYHGGEGPGPR